MYVARNAVMDGIDDTDVRALHVWRTNDIAQRM